MREFDSLAIRSEEHGVVTNDVTATERVHADFTRLAWTDVAQAAVGDVILISGAGFLVEDLEQAAGSPGRGIDLVLVMHLGDLDIEAVLSEHAGRLTGEPEERVHAHRVVGGINDADRLGGIMDEGPLVIGMAGGSDDQVGAVFECGGYQFPGEGMDGEVDDTGGLGDGKVEVLARVVGGCDGHLRLGSGLVDSLAHAARDSGDEK